ncbi:MAG: Multidrug resistance protein MdtA [Chlamydiia bacterium]|nr:Multidrug resistance protein MdtA [Chlamydiia bacterium]MCH9618112.1 Multidrug resistance protein MdtA [Chlamydiia bacterium]MCH9623992.1 Multidrug resistance protein MdtA [Chlamydiia bacterium]
MKNNLLLLLLPFFFFVSCKKAEQKKEPLPRVEVGLVEKKTIPIGLNAVGHCTAYNSAEIKAQVEGVLQTIHYTEGGQVNKGDLLFTIDPRPYQATLDKMIAVRAENLAKLKYSTEIVSRYESLLKEDYVSALEFDGFLRDLAEYEGTIAANDADIRLAQIDLEYCYIRAPFSGVAGKKLIDIGNLISNDGSTMVVINQIDPIFIDFSLPEKDFRTIMKYRKGHAPLTVDIQIPGEKKLRKATLLLVDNSIDPNTGMVPLRAQIQNKDSFFWPGQYVEANLILKEEKDALLIPSKAIGTGQKGRFVFVIDEDNTALYKKIETFNTYGEHTHIKADIKPGDRVVTRGIINVKPHKKCTIITTEKKK